MHLPNLAIILKPHWLYEIRNSIRTGIMSTFQLCQRPMRKQQLVPGSSAPFQIKNWYVYLHVFNKNLSIYLNLIVQDLMRMQELRSQRIEPPSQTMSRLMQTPTSSIQFLFAFIITIRSLVITVGCYGDVDDGRACRLHSLEEEIATKVSIISCILENSREKNNRS